MKRNDMVQLSKKKKQLFIVKKFKKTKKTDKIPFNENHAYPKSFSVKFLYGRTRKKSVPFIGNHTYPRSRLTELYCFKKLIIKQFLLPTKDNTSIIQLENTFHKKFFVCQIVARVTTDVRIHGLGQPHYKKNDECDSSSQEI